MSVENEVLNIRFFLVGTKKKQDRLTTCFNDLWNMFIILEGLVKGVKPLLYQGFADRQLYRTGGARCLKVDKKLCKD